MTNSNDDNVAKEHEKEIKEAYIQELQKKLMAHRQNEPMTLVFVDMCGSTEVKVKERLMGWAKIDMHNNTFLQVLEDVIIDDGQFSKTFIKVMGDGVLVGFFQKNSVELALLTVLTFFKILEIENDEKRLDIKSKCGIVHVGPGGMDVSYHSENGIPTAGNGAVTNFNFIVDVPVSFPANLGVPTWEKPPDFAVNHNAADIIGVSVDITARLCDLAMPSQILVNKSLKTQIEKPGGVGTCFEYKDDRYTALDEKINTIKKTWKGKQILDSIDAMDSPSFSFHGKNGDKEAYTLGIKGLDPRGYDVFEIVARGGKPKGFREYIDHHKLKEIVPQLETRAGEAACYQRGFSMLKSGVSNFLSPRVNNNLSKIISGSDIFSNNSSAINGDLNSASVYNAFDRIAEAIVRCASVDQKQVIKAYGIAHTEMFNKGGILYDLLTQIISKSDSLYIQAILLNPDSESARVRSIIESGEDCYPLTETKVYKDIKGCLEGIDRLNGTAKNRENEPRVSLKLCDFLPQVWYLIVGSVVFFEPYHIGRDSKNLDQYHYYCLGGRVPIIEAEFASKYYLYLDNQFHYLWNYPVNMWPFNIIDPSKKER